MAHAEVLEALRAEQVALLGAPWHVWTDGSCVYEVGAERGGLGWGGWAALVEHGSDGSLYRGRSERTTNVLMELQAAIEGLRRVPAGAHAVLHTDSMELVAAYQTWLAGRLRLRRRRNGRQWVTLAAEYARLGAVTFDVLGKGGRDMRHKRCHLIAGQEAKAAREDGVGWSPGPPGRRVLCHLPSCEPGACADSCPVWLEHGALVYSGRILRRNPRDF